MLKQFSVQNIYIGEYPHFTPGANTIGYYPLRVDFNDKSGNGYNLTVSNASITNLNGVLCASYTDGRAYNTTPAVGSTRTLVAWFINQTSGAGVLVGTGATANGYQAIMLASDGATKVQISDYYSTGYSSGTLTSTRHLGVAVVSGANMYIYVDGVLANSGTHSSTGSSTGVSAGGKAYIDSYTDYFTGYLSEVIIENKAWNATEVSDYYNLTKSNYGL